MTEVDFTFIWVSSRFETLSQGELKLHSMEQEACQGYLWQSYTSYHSISREGTFTYGMRTSPRRRPTAPRRRNMLHIPQHTLFCLSVARAELLSLKHSPIKIRLTLSASPTHSMKLGNLIIIFYWIFHSDQLNFSAHQTYFQRAIYSAQLFSVSFESADLPAALSAAAAAAAFITPPLTTQH